MKRSHSLKLTYLAEIDAAIKSAPHDPPAVAAARAEKPRKVNRSVVGNARDQEKYNAWRAHAANVEMAFSKSRTEFVTFRFGPTTYRIRNTAETLEGFRKRFSARYPATTV